MPTNKPEYMLKYQKEKLKRVPLDLTKAKYQEVKDAADRAGESVNGYIKKSIDQRIDRDKKDRPSE